jgi:hypothetical protein
MPKSNRSGLLGRGSGSVTVIEESVQRSWVRRAKIVFFVVWVVVGLLTAIVLVSTWEHSLGTAGAAVVSLIAGAVAGFLPAFLTALVVVSWPVIRAIWWWLPELAVIGALIAGWAELAACAGLALRLVVLAAFVGIPAAVAPARRYLVSWSWCLVSRHRIRTCFSEFIISNRRGSLPLILAAHPTPAGERLWVLLRPGLSMAVIQSNLDKIAVACWASTVTADLAKPSNSALVRFDIKRRDPLTGRITSPLTAMFGNIVPAFKKDATATVALDLTDVTAEDVTQPARPKNGPVSPPARTPATPGSPLIPFRAPGAFHHHAQLGDRPMPRPGQLRSRPVRRTRKDTDTHAA